MSINTLNDLFVHSLKDIHYAENKVLKALPKLIKAAKDEELQKALEEHRIETEGQIERLKQVFEIIGEKVAAEECEAINGILAEADGMLGDTKGSAVSDDAVIASGQAVEHYEIVRYRSLVLWAGALNLEDAVPLLQQSLDEERRADETLGEFAAYRQTTAVEDEGSEEQAEDDENASRKGASAKSQAKGEVKRKSKAA
jgi:ferritin-like metal-binding protein YciE